MHIPVLVNEIISNLKPENGGWFFDGTLGEGGHARELIKQGASTVIAVDRDLKTLEATVSCLGKLPVHCFHATFDQIEEVTSNFQDVEYTGILLDLGLSSNQLDDGERGFSFLHNGPLDMRMDQSRSKNSALEIVNQWSERELSNVLFEFGDERFANRIARQIVKSRTIEPIRDTKSLASLIYQTVPSYYRHGKIHPATRTFQALRIAVNDELKILRNGLKEMIPLLLENGRIAVISFHSLEDKIVKETFKGWESKGLGRRITAKPIIASDEEISYNPRARSAKLRIFEKGRSNETISPKKNKFSDQNSVK